MSVATSTTSSTQSLLAAYHGHGDAQARTILIERNLPLVRTIARRFARSGEQLEDLVQIGSIGLIKAVDRFRADRGSNLGAYAVPTIVGELRRHARDETWPVRVPRERLRAGLRAAALPLDDDVALDTSAGTEELEASEGRALLRAGFKALTGRERRIVALRFYRDLSQQRIAEEVGLSQVQVSRVLRTSLAKMRAAIEP